MNRLRFHTVSFLIAVSGGVTGAVIMWTVLGRLKPSGAWFNDLLRALAVFVSALAWPAVVALVVVRHRPKIDELIGRVRAIGTVTTFDATPQASAPPPSPIVSAASAGGEEVGAAPA